LKLKLWLLKKLLADVSCDEMIQLARTYEASGGRTYPNKVNVLEFDRKNINLPRGLNGGSHSFIAGFCICYKLLTGDTLDVSSLQGKSNG
jgi:hypothetical protein